MRIKFDSVSPQYQSFYGARNSKTDTAKGFSMWLNYAKFRRAFGAATERYRFIEDENGDIILAFRKGFVIIIK